jgi:uncharacterized damage-inducible protein DinB
MQDKSEAQILAETFEDVRSLTKFYYSLAKEIDPRRNWEINGQKLNSLYWILGHIVWAEHYLLIEAMTGEQSDIPWLPLFDMADDQSSEVNGLPKPTIKEILLNMDAVHAKAMGLLNAMTNEELGEPNKAGIQFRAGDAKRVIVRHAIRHEPCHTGQIGWLLKINGVETV